MLHEFFEGLFHAGISRIAHRHGDVAEKTVILGAPDRRAAKHGSELFFAECGEFRQIRRGCTWCKTFLLCDWRATVPRANILADVAPKQMTAGLGLQIARDGAAFFNR